MKIDVDDAYQVPPRVESPLVDLNVANLARSLLALSINDLFPRKLLSTLAQAKADDARDSAMKWLMDTESAGLFSLRGVCEILRFTGVADITAHDVRAAIIDGDPKRLKRIINTKRKSPWTQALPSTKQSGKQSSVSRKRSAYPRKRSKHTSKPAK